jgi:NAD(P)-dependent dehydrogenase (short-subunit alcohol dehydrogenase family)
MVTGAGGGIGRAICLAFASAGAKVACLDIDLAAAEKTAGASGNEAIAQHCDVSSETETRDAAAATISKFKAFTFWSMRQQPTIAMARFSILRRRSGHGYLPST